jgi:hypothetical protein
MEPSVCLDSSGADAFFSRCAFRLQQGGASRAVRARPIRGEEACDSKRARLLHVRLLLEALLVEQLGAQPLDFLRVFGSLVHHARLLLAAEQSAAEHGPESVRA